MNNREKLIDLMIDNDLERRELAELLRVDRETIDCWLAPTESARRVEVPDMAIELLGFKLGDAPRPADAGEAQEPDTG